MNKDKILTLQIGGSQRKCQNKREMGMDLEIVMLSEVSQRKTNIIYFLYVELKKNGTIELIYKSEIESWIQKTNIKLLPVGKGWEGINWEIWVDI